MTDTSSEDELVEKLVVELDLTWLQAESALDKLRPIIAQQERAAGYVDGLRKARNLAGRHGASFEFIDAIDHHIASSGITLEENSATTKEGK